MHGLTFIGGPNMRPPNNIYGLGLYLNVHIQWQDDPGLQSSSRPNLPPGQHLRQGASNMGVVVAGVRAACDAGGEEVLAMSADSSLEDVGLAICEGGATSTGIGVYRLKLQHLDSLYGWHSSQLSLHGFLIQFCMHGEWGFLFLF